MVGLKWVAGLDLTNSLDNAAGLNWADGLDKAVVLSWADSLDWLALGSLTASQVSTHPSGTGSTWLLHTLCVLHTLEANNFRHQIHLAYCVSKEGITS